MKKRIEHFVKTYFYFNQNERLGVFVLLALIAITLSLKWMLTWWFPAKPFQISIQILNELERHESEPVFENKYAHRVFDTAHYLPKPYKQYPKAVFTQFKKDTVYPKSKKKRVEIVELNSADSATLISLYRIGPALASKIITYRNRLGGFSGLNQLTEIYGFNADILYDLEGKLYVDDKLLVKHNLNTAGFEELKLHPYFKYNLSQAIVNYRNAHGKYHSMSDLKNIKFVNDSIIERIKPYSYIEP